MSAPSGLNLRALITALFIAVAIASLIVGIKQISFNRTQIESRQRELAELETMRKEAAGQRVALDWINANARPEDQIAELIKRHLANVPTDLALRERKDGEGEWTFQRFDLRIDQIKPDILSQFLAACENAHPPIRLIDIQVSAAATSDQQITLQLALAEMTRKTPVSEP